MGHFQAGVPLEMDFNGRGRDSEFYDRRGGVVGVPGLEIDGPFVRIAVEHEIDLGDSIGFPVSEPYLSIQQLCTRKFLYSQSSLIG